LIQYSLNSFASLALSADKSGLSPLKIACLDQAVIVGMKANDAVDD